MQGRLVITEYYKESNWIRRQRTLYNVNASVEFCDEYGRKCIILDIRDDPNSTTTRSYLVTRLIDHKLVNGVHYNQSEKMEKAIKEKKIII